MTQQSQQLRAAFLDSASRLLFLADPSTSSYFGAERVDVFSVNGQAIPQHISDALCAGCGTLSVRGWTGSFNKPGSGCRKDSSDRATKKLGALSTERSRSRICSMCHRVTKLKHHISPDLSGLPRATTIRNLNSSSGKEPEISTKTAVKINSKQRAKARKSKEGLKALLGESKHKPDSSSALDLMDFMFAS